MVTAYHLLLFSVKEYLGTQTSQAPSPTKVVKAYMHILTARHPRIRYAPGWDVKFFYIPLSYMPSLIQDLWTTRILNRFVPASLRN